MGDKLADSRRIAALQAWGLVTESEEGRYKVTDDGRRCAKGDIEKAAVLNAVIRRIPAYLAIVERAAHRREDSPTINDVGAHWHEHFREDASSSEDYLKAQAISFFQLAEGAGLGTMITGRRGAETRFSFNAEALNNFIGESGEQLPVARTHAVAVQPEIAESQHIKAEQAPAMPPPEVQAGPTKRVGQGIFIAHGKNKKPLDNSKTCSSSSESLTRSPLRNLISAGPSARRFAKSCSHAIVRY